MKGKKGKRKEDTTEAKVEGVEAASSDLTKDEKKDTQSASVPAGEAEKKVTAQQGQAEADEPARDALLEGRLLRLQADFENFRKRTLREREDLYRRANEDLMLELLPVLDHLELAFHAAGKDGADHPVVKGFRLVGEQLQQVLQKFGLQPIETQDVDFDPNVHEAIQHLPSEEIPENGVIARTRAGYMLGSRLLRAAQVVVSSGPQSPDTSEA